MTVSAAHLHGTDGMLPPSEGGAPYYIRHNGVSWKVKASRLHVGDVTNGSTDAVGFRHPREKSSTNYAAR